MRTLERVLVKDASGRVAQQVALSAIEKSLDETMAPSNERGASLSPF